VDPDTCLQSRQNKKRKKKAGTLLENMLWYPVMSFFCATTSILAIGHPYHLPKIVRLISLAASRALSHRLRGFLRYGRNPNLPISESRGGHELEVVSVVRFPNSAMDFRPKWKAIGCAMLMGMICNLGDVVKFLGMWCNSAGDLFGMVK